MYHRFNENKYPSTNIRMDIFKNQIDILSSGMKANIPSNNIMEFAAGQYDDPRFKLGKHEWPALLRLLDDNKSIYNQ